MRIIYLQPRVGASRNYRNGSGSEQTWTPWWALALHQHAQPHCNDAVLIDARIDTDWATTLQRALGEGGGDVMLAVSVMTGHAIHDAITASQVGHDAGATVVWGGPHPTLFADEIIELPYVDRVVRGFGALHFGRLVADAVHGRRRSEFVIDARGDQSLLAVARRRHVVPVTTLRPPLDLVPAWGAYVNSDHAIGERAVNLITSEGCLRRCTYCSEPATSLHSWLAYEVDDCVATASEVVGRADADSVKLHDPNFLQNLERGLTFADRFRKTVGLPWAATIHPADVIDVERRDLERLADCGLRRVLVGLESPDQSLVKIAGKAFKVDRISEIAHKLADHGIAGMFTFIVGWPGADPDHYQRTIDAALGLRDIDDRHQAKIHFLEPWPGTPIHELMARRFGFPEMTIEDWAGIDYYFAHHPALHDAGWERRIRLANEELSPYVEA